MVRKDGGREFLGIGEMMTQLYMRVTLIYQTCVNLVNRNSLISPKD